MSIQEEIMGIKKELPINTHLVAVSKYHPIEAIESAYSAGQRIFGESKVQELVQKHELLSKDIRWHFIGHLQTNKVKLIVPFVSLIHSVDKFKLLKEIDKQASKIDRKVPCLLQIHIAQEESKFGFTFDECRCLLKSREFQELKHIEIHGLMGMATNTRQTTLVQKEFQLLQSFFEEIKATLFKEKNYFKELSMGMSNDYLLAIKYGSTLIRIGTRIFGLREY